MGDAEAVITSRRSIAFVWLVPIVAALIGAGMVLYTFLSQGPEITVVFSTSEGIEAGNTRIKTLNVDVGIVESAGLSEDLEHVVVKARLEKTATPLLREDTQFWVVRPRVGTGGVSGLGTLLSGVYIQLAPGTGEPGRRSFVGLDEPPVTPAGTPGLHFELVSDYAGSVGVGDPILYKDFPIGRIDNAEFDVTTHELRYGAFIEAPYDSLVTSATRFWNASGISMSVGAGGIEIDTASLESLLIGGVAMGLPQGVEPADPVENGATFRLFPNRTSVNERPYRQAIEYVVRFPQSIRGLQPGAPVEYRGIPAGRVERVLLEELAALGLRGEGSPIPVLIRLEPGRLKLPDSEEGARAMAEAIENSVAIGMRATLATGSLLTGSLYIALDIYPDEASAEIGSFAGRPTIPAVASGLAGIEQKVATLLDKLNSLPLEGTVKEAERALVELNTILGSESMQTLPDSLEATLAELRGTLASVSTDSPLQQRLLQTINEIDRTLVSLRDLLDALEEQPNALIFNRAPGTDLQPPSGSP